MKDVIKKQDAVSLLLALTRDLLDHLYSARDAELDEEIQVFRAEVLYQLNQWQDMLLDQMNQPILESFVYRLIEIGAEQEAARTSDNSSPFSLLMMAASNNNIGPHGKLTSVINLYINYNLALKPLLNKNNTELKSVKELLQSYYQANTKIRLPMCEIEQSIEQSYVNLALVDEVQHRTKEEKVLRSDQPVVNAMGSLSNRLRTYEDIYQVTQSVPLESLFSKSRQVIVLGRAGIGKSTFCKYISYQWSKLTREQHLDDNNEANSTRALVEFDALYWLPLRHLRYYRLRDGLDSSIIGLAHLAHFIYYVLDNECQDRSLLQNLTEEHIFAQLNDPKQKILLLLDGYDEIEMLLHVKDTQEKTLAGKLFAALLKQPDYVLTSRPYAVQRNHFPLPKHYYYELLGFTDAHIPIYVKQMFEAMQKPVKEGQTLLQLLRTNPSIWGAAHVPIHLAMICAVLTPAMFADCEYVTMSKLYQKLVHQLGKRFFEQQCQERTDELQPPELEIAMAPLADFLAELALTGLVQDTLIFDYTILAPIVERYEKILSEYLTRLKPQTSEMQHTKSKLALLNLIKPIIKTGFLHAVNLHESAVNSLICYFPHASLQEYFTAYGLVKWLKKEIKPQYALNHKTYSKAWDFIKQTIKNPRYEIVYWFLSGFLQTEPDCLEKFLDILVNKLRKKAVIDKAKQLFGHKKALFSITIKQLLEDNNKFRYAMLLSRCFEEANMPMVQRKTVLLQMYKMLTEVLFIYQAEKPINRYYHLWVDYLKLSPNLLNTLNVLSLLAQAKKGTENDRVHARLDLTVSLLQVEDVVESLIRVIDNKQNINLCCEAMESLVLVAHSSEYPSVKKVLLNCVKKESNSMSLVAVKHLLKIAYSDEHLAWLIKHLVSNDHEVKIDAIQYLLDVRDDTLLTCLCQLDLLLKDYLVNCMPILNWSNKKTISHLQVRHEIPWEYKLRVGLIGADFYGRSELAKRFVYKSYEKYNSNFGGNNNHHKSLKTIDQKWGLYVNVFLSPLEDIFPIIADSEILIVCFYITSTYSFEDAKEMCSILDRMQRSILLAGLKKDLEDEREVSFYEGLRLANKYNSCYLECSAITGENVEDLFILAAKICSSERKTIYPFRIVQRIKSILIPEISFEGNNSQLISILKILQEEGDIATKKWSKRILVKLNTKDNFQINLLSLMHNRRYSSELIKDISNEQLAVLDKTHSGKIVQSCIENLLDNSDQEMIEIMLDFLAYIEMPNEQVISSYFKMVEKEGVINEFLEKRLLELDITWLNDEQGSILYKICTKNLSNQLLTMRELALNKLKQLKKTNTLEVIEIYLKNISCPDLDIYREATEALLELQGSLSKVQRQMIFDIYVRHLSHEQKERRQCARLALQRLDQAGTKAVIDKYIKNLSRRDPNIYQEATEALLELQGNLSEAQREMIFDNYVRHLSHKRKERRQCARLTLQRLGQAGTKAVIETYIKNLSHTNLDFHWKDTEVWQRLSEVKRKINGPYYDIYLEATEALLELQGNLTEEQRETIFDIYVRHLSHKRREQRQYARLALQRLGQAGTKAVIETYIDNLSNPNFDIYQEAAEALQELQGSLSKIQCETIANIYANANIHTKDMRHVAISAIKRVGKVVAPEVIAVHIKNLTHPDDDIHEMAVQALREVENLLSETQRQEIYNSYVQELDQTNLKRRQCAITTIKRMGEIESPEGIATYIKNLTHNNEVVYTVAAKALLKLETKLNKAQLEFVCKAHIENLSHLRPAVQQEALKYLRFLATKNVAELLQVYTDNLPDVSKVIFSVDLYSYCKLSKDLWLIFNKHAPADFKRRLLSCLYGEITVSNLMAAIILLWIDRSRETLLWLIKPILCSDLYIQKTMVRHLFEKGEDELLTELYQIDSLLRTIIRKAIFFQPSLKYKIPINLEVHIALIGGEGCGKSALLSQFVSYVYVENYYPTIEDTYFKFIKINEQAFSLKLFDTAGDERHIAERDQCVKASDIVLVCFSVDNKVSFEYAKKLCEAMESSKIILLIGMKKDLVNERQVSREEGPVLASNFQTKYFECSAKTSEGVNELFIFAAKLAFDRTYEKLSEKMSQIDIKYQSILAPSLMSNDKKYRLKEIFEKLGKDVDTLTKARAKIILAELNAKNPLMINIGMHIDNMVYDNKILQSISMKKLEKCEKKHKNEVTNIYIEMLKNSKSEIKKVIISRLRQLSPHSDENQRTLDHVLMKEQFYSSSNTSDVKATQKMIDPVNDNCANNEDQSNAISTLKFADLISQQNSPVITHLSKQTETETLTNSSEESTKTFT